MKRPSIADEDADSSADDAKPNESQSKKGNKKMLKLRRNFR